MTTGVHKTPYWLTEKEFFSLSELLSQEKFAGEVYDGIREELGVARTRAKTSRISTNSLIVALGLSKGSIPVHLSDQEVESIKNIELLSPEMKSKLK